MNKLVSVIVPFYNVEDYIEHCLKSIVDQTYKRWELILVDDGSSDSSYEICNRYSRDHENIRLFHRDRAGVSSARNYGLSKAEGDYILFVDADDWISADMLEVMLREGKGADLIACDHYKVRTGNGIQTISPRNTWDKESTFRVKDKYLEILSRSATLWNKLIKREIIGSVRFHEDKTYGEDMVFISELLPFVRDAVIIPLPLYYYYYDREGNVISADIDKRSVEFLDNSYYVYSLLSEIREYRCGVYRIFFAQHRIFDRIAYKRRKRYRSFIRYCGKVLRKVPLRRRIHFAMDRRFGLSLLARLLFLFSGRFPYLSYCIRKILKKENR